MIIFKIQYKTNYKKTITNYQCLSHNQFKYYSKLFALINLIYTPMTKQLTINNTIKRIRPQYVNGRIKTQPSIKSKNHQQLIIFINMPIADKDTQQQTQRHNRYQINKYIRNRSPNARQLFQFIKLQKIMKQKGNIIKNKIQNHYGNIIATFKERMNKLISLKFGDANIIVDNDNESKLTHKIQLPRIEIEDNAQSRSLQFRLKCLKNTGFYTQMKRAYSKQSSHPIQKTKKINIKYNLINSLHSLNISPQQQKQSKTITINPQVNQLRSIISRDIVQQAKNKYKINIQKINLHIRQIYSKDKNTKQLMNIDAFQQINIK